MNIHHFLLSLLIIGSQSSCSSNKKTIEQKKLTNMEISEPIGIWQDNIGLSLHEAEIKANGGQITVNTEKEWWWISEISLNGEIYADFSSINFEANEYIISKDFFTLEKSDKKTIVIKLEENTSNQKRTVVVGLQAGNYFDKITLTQSAK